MSKKNFRKIELITAGVLTGAFVVLHIVGKKSKEKDAKNIDDGNQYLQNDSSKKSSVKQHKASGYERVWKPVIDKFLSFGGLVILAPVYGIISLAIVIDDPGPVLFTQKRVGKDKHFFKLHKFRSMRMSTPHDTPTHLLDNPEQYITRVGRFLRKTSLDELPQIWDIFVGNMSIIGPRPALWNQDDLVEERDKWGANNGTPGLTGWAQINGRDELEIPDKAKLDGDYVTEVEKGGLKALLFDIKCFFGTISSVANEEGVVEGSTGEMKKQGCRFDTEGVDWMPIQGEDEYQTGNGSEKSAAHHKILVVCQYYYPENFQITPICEEMVQDGYEVTVLTGLPNYPTGIIPEEYKHGQKRDEVINGVHVIRCDEIGRQNGAVRLALNYGSYAFLSVGALSKLDNVFDCVLVYQLSPVTMAYAGIKYAKKHRVPMILYCCDIWPESMKMYVKDENNPAFKLAKKISRNIYSSADRIIAQSTSFIDYLVKTHGLDRSKITYIPAFADETYLTQDFTPEDGNGVNFVFLGNLGLAQNLIAVLQAVEMIKDVPGFKVHFVGDGTVLEEMKQFVNEHHLENIVQFYGRRPVEEMPKYYKLATVCLVSLNADSAIGLTLPSKVQGYMAAGKPIIGMIDGSAKVIIDESNCGICVNAGDIEGLAKAMRSFIEDPEKYTSCGEKGREYFRQNFAKDIFMKKLEVELTNVRRIK